MWVCYVDIHYTFGLIYQKIIRAAYHTKWFLLCECVPFFTHIHSNSNASSLENSLRFDSEKSGAQKKRNNPNGLNFMCVFVTLIWSLGHTHTRFSFLSFLFTNFNISSFGTSKRYVYKRERKKIAKNLTHTHCWVYISFEMMAKAYTNERKNRKFTPEKERSSQIQLLCSRTFRLANTTNEPTDQINLSKGRSVYMIITIVKVLSREKKTREECIPMSNEICSFFYAKNKKVWEREKKYVWKKVNSVSFFFFSDALKHAEVKWWWQQRCP